MIDRHIILVGLPGSGKSTVGPRVAEALGVPFEDLDAIIIRRMGMPVARIFGEFGEAHFRKLEREVTAERLAAPPSVIAPGGGWAAQPGNLDGARERALVVYLQVAPAIALERAGQGAVRPLLAGGDGLARMNTLLAERESFYQQANTIIGNDHADPMLAATEIVEWIRRGGFA
ncbi:MAG TPA: shikimate kinase [Gemmatimonadales bacterium]|nr:shikimate kinase [Gemmatimonadales bacterium]